jgi:hypothetical protein
MKSVRVLFSVALGVGLLGALAVGGYFGVKFIVDLFAMLDPQAVIVTAIASVMTLLCAVLIHRGCVLASQKEVNTYTRLGKAQLYERILLLWGTKLKNQAVSGDPSVDDELQQLAQLLTLRGSSRVIKAYLELHALEKTGGLLSPDIPSRFVTVQMEMRKDLGLSMQTLNAEDLLQLFFAEVKVAPGLSKAQQRQDLHPRVSLAANV